MLECTNWGTSDAMTILFSVLIGAFQMLKIKQFGFSVMCENNIFIQGLDLVSNHDFGKISRTEMRGEKTPSTRTTFSL
jgi:hypothetical protein